MERVQKIIANSGLMSRRKADELVAMGKVFVNGKKAVAGEKADPAKDVIEVLGKKIVSQKKLYLIFNKPKYVICSMEKVVSGKSIKDFFNPKERVYPAGRLDYDSEGLVFLTNDGEVADKIMHPKYETEKEYIVNIDKAVTDDELKKLRSGVELEDGMSWPAKIEILENRMMLDITMHEGRKAQIKRMFAALGFKVLSLVRIRIGNIFLGELRPGKARELSFEEYSSLKHSLQQNAKRGMKHRSENLEMQKKIRPNKVKYVKKELSPRSFRTRFEQYQAEKKRGIQ